MVEFGYWLAFAVGWLVLIFAISCTGYILHAIVLEWIQELRKRKEDK